MIFMFMCAWAQEYLTASTVEQHLKDQQPVFSNCSSLTNQLYQVRFSIDSTGKGRLIEGESCFSIIEKVQFPSHPSRSRVFIWNVASQDGVLFPQTLSREKVVSVLLPGFFAADKKRLLIQLEGEK